MKINETAEIQISDFFELVEQDGGVYEVQTPQGWVEIGDMKREQKECFLLRTASGSNLEAGHDHLVETQNGWEKVEDINIEQTIVNTRDGQDQVVAREYVGIKDTFDFEVLSREHKYYANGIVSHNCGKTLTCKWLRGLCEANNFAYRIVSMEDYREAMSRGRVRNLFRLQGRKSGIIFFDDMDVMVEDRKKGNNHLSTFLAELDGLEEVEGVVYVFTTNYMKELDEAFVRPGRIDLWLPFKIPTTKLRKKFVTQQFDKEILDVIDSKGIVENTKDYSFAELEEIRKLFCMDIISGKEIDIDKTFGIYNKHRKDFEERAIMGFGSLNEEDDDEYDDDEFMIGFPSLPRRFR